RNNFIQQLRLVSKSSNIRICTIVSSIKTVVHSYLIYSEHPGSRKNVLQMRITESNTRILWALCLIYLMKKQEINLSQSFRITSFRAIQLYLMS
ncbi:hypothetical protein PMAYCL1PPCAC_25178, partial [Pristionchus mayeri]